MGASRAQRGHYKSAIERREGADRSGARDGEFGACGGDAGEDALRGRASKARESTAGPRGAGSGAAQSELYGNCRARGRGIHAQAGGSRTDRAGGTKLASSPAPASPLGVVQVQEKHTKQTESRN